MTDTRVRTLSIDGVTVDPVMLADGTLWSHAATMGTWYYGDQQFTLDRAEIESFVKNFSTGYPRKVPVDYEHGSEKETLGQPVPKAGDVLELRGVFSAADFTGDLKTAAEKLAARAGRSLGDPESFGLWMRWRPLARSLAMVKAGEYTEHSIAFDLDYTSPHTGESQGPTLTSVALTNRPFLDGMIPIAATRDDHSAGRAGKHSQEQDAMENKLSARLLTALAAVTLTAPADEDQAVTQLTALGTEVKALRAVRDELATATGETDPTKALAQVKSLKSDVAKFEAEAKTAKKAKIDADITATFRKFEDRLVPAQHPFFRKQLTAELDAGAAKVEETETYKAIDAMKPHGIAGQQALADDGTDTSDATDKQLLSRIDELLKTDEFKELSRSKGQSFAFNQAAERAEEEIAAKA